MRLSIVLLAVILFLRGLSDLGAVTLTGHIFGWLLVIDAGLFILEPVLPMIPFPKSRDQAS